MPVVTFACLFFGDGPDKIFMVKVLEKKNVNTLKEIIWAKHANSYPFNIINARKLLPPYHQAGLMQNYATSNWTTIYDCPDLT